MSEREASYGPDDLWFDFVTPITLPGPLGATIDIVFHRGPEGQLLAWHSPLTIGTIRCTICEGGARVYVR